MARVRELSPYVELRREQWRKLRDATPLTLSLDEVVALRGLGDPIDLEEVVDVYLPLSRLISLQVAARQRLAQTTADFLREKPGRVPFVIGIAGSVAVGKSTTARVLRALLSRWPDHPRVELVTTDGFLHPNRVLEARGLMNRKGFPESYDVRALLRFVSDVKSGVDEARAPVYSHQRYDRTGEHVAVQRPDVLIVEGLNVLQTGTGHAFVSDFFDFTIYVDAPEEEIERWYVERFLTLRATVFTDPASYFHRYAALDDAEAVATARRIWREINAVNLRENVLPTRERARLILEKGRDHEVKSVRLRKL